jgi:hypothetical protein
MRWSTNLRRASAALALTLAGMAFPTYPAQALSDLAEWEYPAPPESGLDCDPDVLIWKRFCPDCVSGRPLEHCSDAALR